MASLDAIAARGAIEAPQMREILRVSDVSAQAEIRAERDLCVRAAFDTATPAQAWFEDGAAAPRGEKSAGTSGMVPPQGPACVVRGETLRLVVIGAGRDAGPSGSAIFGRAVVWASP